MYYLIYLTERCNLKCLYCEAAATRQNCAVDVEYSVDDLVSFLRQDPQKVGLQFYGGEPLLRSDLLIDIVERAEADHVTVQTNGLLLERLEPLLDKIDIVAISLDGPEELTDAARGEGVYAKAIEQAHWLRDAGYAGRVDVRMTHSPGMQVRDAVGHFLDECSFSFDAIYWQLNVMFHQLQWRQDKRFIRRWFENYYNPQTTELVERWVAELESGQLRPIISFAALMHTLLTGEVVDHVRCGAGKKMWTIATDGAIYPCPVMRGPEQYNAGTIRDTAPDTIGARFNMLAPCDSCEVFGICGGRCLCANVQKGWGEDGYALVCDSVKHLIAELGRVAPRVRAVVDGGGITLDDLDLGLAYEVIP